MCSRDVDLFEGVAVDAVVRGDGVLKADVGAVPRASDLLRVDREKEGGSELA